MNNQRIRTWQNAFTVTLGNIKSYKCRLKELLTWSKPLCKKANDTNGKWTEWACKIVALEELIENENNGTK